MVAGASTQEAGDSTQVIEIIVIGLAETGKTTFIKTISQNTRWDGDPSNSWLLGHLAIDDGLVVHFMEPPAQDSFDFMWLRDLIEEADVAGYIVLIDSYRDDLFGEAVFILHTIRIYHPETPCVVAATKSDHPQAWSPDDIRVGLYIPDDTPVIACVASDMTTVKDVVLQLLYKVLNL